MSSRAKFVTALIAVALSACAPAASTRKPGEKAPVKAKEAKTAPTATPGTKVEPASERTRKVAVFLLVRPDGNPATLASILEAEPRLKITFIFPPAYFDGDARKAAIPRFKVLQSSKQVEAALSLANEPILPLIENLKTAGAGVDKWGFAFSWPEDVAAQAARASGAYQTRWAELPSGFYAPYGSASQKVIEILRRFRLNWVLLHPSDTWGVRFVGGTAVVVPQTLPLGDETLPAPVAAEATANAVASRPFSLIDGADWPSAEHEVQFLRALARAAKTTEFETAAPFVTGLREEFAFPEGKDPFQQNYEPWVSSPQQKRAWQGLAEARQVVANYKNSGRADLTRLDAATEEMCAAESGAFLLALGQPDGAPIAAQQNFLATLGNIYRLAGVPVPPNLNTWFADRSVRRPEKRAVDNDRPFFIDEPRKLTWNDPRGDDNGDGSYVYPSGIGPKGLFDLREVSLSWTDQDVTLSIVTAEPPSPSAPMLPAADVYIDVNRLIDAGATQIISQRGKGSIQRDAAWEYAVSLSPKVVVLYQGLPGGERIVSTLPAGRVPGGFSATFPRSSLRGDPRNWRLSVGLGATEPTNRDEAATFIPITPTASPKTFGGGGVQSPRYIDLLAPSADAQNAALKPPSGSPAVLPYVEAE